MAACPTCGKDLTYVPQYGRFYCYSCGRYAPKEFGAVPSAGPAIALGGAAGHAGHYHCPTCDRELTFIPQYNRYYCYPEAKYAPRDIRPVSGDVPTAAETIPEPSGAEPVSAPSEPSERVAEEVEGAGVSAASAEPESEAEDATVDRPHLDRAEIARARKSDLVAWARAHELDADGTKAQVRARLLQYLDEREEEEDMEGRETRPADDIETGVDTPSEVTPAAPEERSPEEMPAAASESAPVAEVAPSTETIGTAADAEAPSPEGPAVEVPREAAAAPERAPFPSRLTRCPTCRGELTYIAQYDRWYCFSCGHYAPKGYGQPTPAASPEARAPPVATPAARMERAPSEPAPVRKVEHPCPTCGRELTYIRQYDRHYCYRCGKYAPRKVRNPCPTCGAELRFIEQYRRWYCEAEGRYAPASHTVARAAVAPTRVESPVSPRPVVRQKATATAPVRVSRTRTDLAQRYPQLAITFAAFGFFLLILARLAGGLLPLFGAELLGSLSPLAAAQVWTGIEVVGLFFALLGVVLGLRAIGNR